LPTSLTIYCHVMFTMAQIIYMFMIYFHIKFHTASLCGSLVFTSRPNYRCRLHVASMLLIYNVPKHCLGKCSLLFEYLIQEAVLCSANVTLMS
jgi:hypothetical protein